MTMGQRKERRRRRRKPHALEGWATSAKMMLSPLPAAKNVCFILKSLLL
jgi:hypothetical protein